LEWVSVEDRSGTVKPYAVNPVSWARTAITNGGSPVSLEAGEWLGFSFDANSYWINPEATTSLYRHEVGTATSWTAMANAAYTPPVDDPAFLLSLNAPYARPYSGTDTIAISGAGVSSPTSAIDVDGNIVVSGVAGNNSQTSADSIVTVTFASAQDFSAIDYQGFLAIGGLVYVRFKEGVKLELKIGGVWQTPPQTPFLNPDDRTKTGVVVRMKGFAGANAVQAVRMTVRAEPQPHKTGVAYTLSGHTFGGCYLGATVSGDRAWDAAYKTADITYGVRYRDVAGATVTGIKQSTFDASRFGTYFVDNLLDRSCLGDRVSLEITPLTTGGYSDDPSGLSYKIEYLRLDQNGVWHILGTAPNTSGQSWRDGLEEIALQALSAASPAVTGYVAPTLAPVFSTGSLTSGFAYHGCVVWLYNQGKANIRYSRVGDAESLANPSDDAEDLARGADFTMADDFADAPLGGVQAGDAAIILGKEGCYAQSGTAPYTMTPPRKIPGSAGGAGRFAFTRYVDTAGNPGMAWFDSVGENVWFASAGLVYSGDSQARPVELSSPIRGSLRSFLLTGQRETIEGLALSQARMDYDSSTGSLWLILGQRAAVLRPRSLIDGQQQWEFLQFALGTATGDVDACSDPFDPESGSDEARSGGTLTWSSPGDVIAGPGLASTSAYLPGVKSRWLKGSSFVPGVLLPAEATLTGLTLRIRQRATSLGEGPCPVKLAAVDAYNGATLKYSTVGALVSSSWEDYDVSLPLGSMATDVAGVNSGVLSARVAYDAVPDTVDAYNPAKWTVTVTPDQIQRARGSLIAFQTMTATATWIGGGAAPAFVALNLMGTASGGGEGGVDLPSVYATGYTGTASVTNGCGQTATGSIMAPTPDPPPAERTATGSKKFVVSVAGGVATKSVTMTANVSVSPSSTQDAVGHFHLEAAIATPDSTTVEVESMLMIACYSVPVAEGERSIAYLAFGPDRNLVWLRSSGHLDAVEWCPTCEAYIDGTSRDGGLTMPGGYWESGRLPGPPRRLTRAEVERDGFEAVTLTSFTERMTAGAMAIAPAGQRWARFGMGQVGSRHRIRVSVPEALAGVSAIDMVFNRVDGPGR
jgi:hypothetical protein